MNLSHRIIDSFPRMVKLRIITFIPVLFALCGRKPRPTKLVVILLFVENFPEIETIQDLSLWLRTLSNPADINRFQSLTGIKILTICLTRNTM